MDTKFDAEVIILGMGSAGLLIAVELAKCLKSEGIAPNNILMIGRNSGGASILSSWYVPQYDPERLRVRLIKGLGNHSTQEQTHLMHYIADNHIAATERFKSEVIAHADVGGVKVLGNGFSGIKTLTGYSTNQSLPGKKILRFLCDHAERLGVRKVVANIEDLERIGGGYRVYATQRDDPVSFTARQLVIATGGMAHMHEIATSAKATMKNVLELSRDRLGITVKDLDRAVFFPFAIYEEGYRVGSLLPPSFMTRSDIVEERVDGTHVDFLKDELKAGIASGDYRPQFPELAALFWKIRASGSKVLVKTRMSREEFEEYKVNDSYGYVFKNKEYEQALSLSVAPAYHSMLGGIVVDSKCASTDPSVFVFGESALIYGTDRPLGGEHMFAITLAPLVARVIAEQCVIIHKKCDWVDKISNTIVRSLQGDRGSCRRIEGQI